MKSFDREILEKALSRLGELAEADGLTLELCIYGGALMVLAYDTRVATKDVDAILRPRDECLKLAKQVAVELGLQENWLNDDVKMFLAPKESLRSLPKQYQGLQLTAPTAGYLLAMKCLACRPSLPGHQGDVSDIQFLIRKMEIHTLQEIQEHIDKYYPDDVLHPQQRLILAAVMEEVWS
jgi:hypothetical protein